MDAADFRRRSLELAARAGLSIVPTLPLLESSECIRTQAAAADRLLCLHAIAAASYGFDKAKALAWLVQEQLDASLTGTENRFLERDEGSPQSFQVQVEGMWALAWALGLVQELDFWKDCDNGFVTMMPNLKTEESGEEVRSKSRLRPVDELASACDTAYCLHWAVRQSELEGKRPPDALKPYVVIERRRALEWLLGDEPWDALSLDT